MKKCEATYEGSIGVRGTISSLLSDGALLESHNSIIPELNEIFEAFSGF